MESPCLASRLYSVNTVAASLKAQDRRFTLLTVDLPERRRGISDLARGRLLLEHAVTYLLREQARRAEDNQAAMMILCRSMSQTAADERRAPERMSMLSWIERLTIV